MADWWYKVSAGVSVAIISATLIGGWHQSQAIRDELAEVKAAVMEVKGDVRSVQQTLQETMKPELADHESRIRLLELDQL